MLITGFWFGGFQALMPLIGWVCVHTLVQYFTAFEKFVPWIAFALLGFIGGKMLYESIKGGEEETPPQVGFLGLIVQGVATSIDALSVGFTIADYTFTMALACVGVIAAITFVLCAVGIEIGKRFGTKFSEKATAFGGVILIVIGIEIFITGLL